MALFRPCLGKTACVDDATRCRACGRSHAEIAQTRAMVDALAALALTWDYENADAFVDYVARKAAAKVRHRREPEAAGV